MKKILFFIALLSSIIVLTNVSYANLYSNNILTNVALQYKNAASTWAGVIQNYAEYFFSGLAVMGFVWQISQAYFHRGSLEMVLL